MEVPGPAPGAMGAWRLLLLDLDESQPRRRCCVGHVLFPGRGYDLPRGSLIVGQDTFTGQDEVLIRLWRVTWKGHLAVDRELSLPRRKAFNGNVRRSLRSRLRRYPPGPFDPMRPPRQVDPAAEAGLPSYTVRIPDADHPEPWLRPWRRQLLAMREEAFGGAVVVGDWLTPGTSYTLPVHRLIVVCDPSPDDRTRRVRILRVGRGGRLVTERDSVLSRRFAFGPSVRETMRHLLYKYPPQPAPHCQPSAAE